VCRGASGFDFGHSCFSRCAETEQFDRPVFLYPLIAEHVPTSGFLPRFLNDDEDSASMGVGNRPVRALVNCNYSNGMRRSPSLRNLSPGRGGSSSNRKHPPFTHSFECVRNAFSSILSSCIQPAFHGPYSLLPPVGEKVLGGPVEGDSDRCVCFPWTGRDSVEPILPSQTVRAQHLRTLVPGKKCSLRSPLGSTESRPTGSSWSRLPVNRTPPHPGLLPSAQRGGSRVELA